MASVKTWLWFDGGVDDAAAFYVALIPGSRIVSTMPYTPADGEPGPGGPADGQSLAVELELAGVPYALLNGGPVFPQSEAVSIEVRVDSQEELDRIWDALVADGGAESQCGWCKDRWGVSWQITPTRLYELLQGPRAAQVTAEMYTQRRLDIAKLEAAAAG